MIVEVDLGLRNIDGGSFASTGEGEQRIRTATVDAGMVPWVDRDLVLPVHDNSYSRPVVSIVNEDPIFSGLSQGVDQDTLDTVLRNLGQVSRDSSIRILDDELHHEDSSQLSIGQGVHYETRTYIDDEEVDLMALAEEGVEIELNRIDFRQTKTSFYFISFGPVKDYKTVMVAINDSSNQDTVLARFRELGYAPREN